MEFKLYVAKQKHIEEWEGVVKELDSGHPCGSIQIHIKKIGKYIIWYIYLILYFHKESRHNGYASKRKSVNETQNNVLSSRSP